MRFQVAWDVTLCQWVRILWRSEGTLWFIFSGQAFFFYRVTLEEEGTTLLHSARRTITHPATQQPLPHLHCLDGEFVQIFVLEFRSI